MTVSRKPSRIDKDSENALGKKAKINVEAIINRGGTVAKIETEKTVRSRKSILIKLPLDTIAKINVSLEARSVKIPRQIWIEEAIQEKLKTEEII